MKVHCLISNGSLVSLSLSGKKSWNFRKQYFFIALSLLYDQLNSINGIYLFPLIIGRAVRHVSSLIMTQIPPLSIEVKREECSAGQIAVAYSFTSEVKKCRSLWGEPPHKKVEMKNQMCILKLNIASFGLCSIFSVRAYTFFFASLQSTE